MRISGTRPERIEVEVQDSELLEVLELRIRRFYRIIHGQWLKDGKLYHEEYTSHPWTSCDGPATLEQIEGFAMIENLKKVMEGTR